MDFSIIFVIYQLVNHGLENMYQHFLIFVYLTFSTCEFEKDREMHTKSFLTFIFLHLLGCFGKYAFIYWYFNMKYELVYFKFVYFNIFIILGIIINKLLFISFWWGPWWYMSLLADRYLIYIKKFAVSVCLVSKHSRFFFF